MEYIFGFFVTWVLILTPPVLIRFAVLRKPISSKVIAITISAALLILNFAVFAFLGSRSKTHAVLFLGAWVCFAILRYRNKDQMKKSALDERKS